MDSKPSVAAPKLRTEIQFGNGTQWHFSPFDTLSAFSFSEKMVHSLKKGAGGIWPYQTIPLPYTGPLSSKQQSSTKRPLSYVPTFMPWPGALND